MNTDPDAGFAVTEPHPGVFHLQLQRPAKRNALSPAMLAGLHDRVVELDKRVDYGVVVLSGSDGCFSAGYDLGHLERDSLVAGERLVDELCEAIGSAHLPVLAAIDGICFGAAFDVACCCDFAVAGADARFCLPPAKLGIVYSPPGTRRIAARIGDANCRYLLYTGDPVSADRALAMGAVQLLTAAGGAVAHTLEIANRMVTSRAPLSVLGAKKVVASATDPAEWPAVERLRRTAIMSDDLAAGIAAARSRTTVRFLGR